MYTIEKYIQEAVTKLMIKKIRSKLLGLKIRLLKLIKLKKKKDKWRKR